MEIETFTRYADLFGGVFEPLKDQPIDCIKDPKDKINMLVRYIKRFEKTKDCDKFIKILSRRNWMLLKFSAPDKLPYGHNGVNSYFSYLCKNGYLYVAKWLYALDIVDIHAENEYAFRWACINGHLHVAQWLYSLGGVNVHAENDFAFKSSYTKILNWFKTLKKMKIDFFVTNIKMEAETFTRYAGLFGGVFEPLKDQPIDCIKDPKDKINMLTRQIKRFEETKDYDRFVKILSHKDWLLSKFSSSDKLPYEHDEVNDYFIYLCKKGHLCVAQWLYALNIVNIHAKNKMNSGVFYLTCLSGHLHVAQWLYSLDGADIDAGNYQVFLWTCAYGHLEVAKWLYPFGCFDIHACDDYIFRLTCARGHLKVAQWLYSLGGVNIHAWDDESFRYACEHGNFNMAQWLYSFGGVNVHIYNDYAFCGTCSGGHLHMAQWLYSLGGVSIHADNDYAFRWACTDGHLEVAKWLYSLGGVDIHAWDDWAFNSSSTEITNWLKTLEK